MRHFDGRRIYYIRKVFATSSGAVSNISNAACSSQRRTNAMIVESMHPYKKGTSHIVELTPSDNDGNVESGKNGLAICFDDYCDFKSGNAEIR